MDEILVDDGVPRRGTVRASGAEAARSVSAASLLAEEDHRIDNVPDLADGRTCSPCALAPFLILACLFAREPSP